MKCPKCDTVNANDSKYCKECAASLTAIKGAQPSFTETHETPVEKLTCGTLFADRYEIIEELGKGGMGVVYLAQDTELDRKVAIKFLREEMQIDNKSQARLMREAKAAASLDHPFVCKVYETGQFEGKAFIVMEYIKGNDLREKLDKGALSLRDSFQIALEIAEALEEAHEKGIVHRDLKPSNIMITPHGHVKVMDFGLAKHYQTESDFTQTLMQDSITDQGAIVGTFAYMSPEQARGEKADARSDIFSLGIIIFEMTTGRHPFSKATPLDTVSSILREGIPPVNIKPKSMNPFLSSIFRKALAKEPENRYQNIKELINSSKIILRKITGGTRFIFRPIPLIGGGIIVAGMVLAGAFFLNRLAETNLPVDSPPKVSILISDFQNKTGDSVFDGALEQVFGIGLDDPLISVYDRQKARKLLKQLFPTSDDHLDIERAQLICRREGINIIVAGSIAPSGDGHNIKVWALDSITSKKVAERTKTIGKKADVPQAAHILSVELRSDLSGIPLDSAEYLERSSLTTTSLEALNALSLAQRFLAEGKQEEAISEYRRAIKEDPKFGRAYSGLGVIYLSRGEYDKGKENLKQALIHIDTLTAREKYGIRSIWYGLTRDYEKIIEECTALLELYPNDPAGHGNLSYAYFMVRNMSKAAEHGKIVAGLQPNNVGARYNLSWYSLGAGDFELAKQEASKALELNPKFELAYVSLALSDLALGQIDLAARTYKQLKSLSSWGASLGSLGLADIALYEGRLESAKKILDEGISIDFENNRSDLAAQKIVMLAHIYLLLGQKDHAHKLADQAYAERKEIDVSFPVSQYYLQVVRLDKAASIASGLSKQLESEPRAYAKLIEAEMSLGQGDTQKAIDLLNESQQLLDSWLAHLSLGRSFLEAKAYTKAHSEFETCLRRGGEATSIFFNDNPSFYYFPQVHYYLGQALEGLGSPAASDSYRRYLQIKLKGEGEWMIEDARHRLRIP